MQRRHEGGLPLAAESTSANVAAERRAEWDAFVMESAREAGEAYRQALSRMPNRRRAQLGLDAVEQR